MEHSSVRVDLPFPLHESVTRLPPEGPGLDIRVGKLPPQLVNAGGLHTGGLNFTAKSRDRAN